MQEDINHPNYYQNNGIEVMDVIRDYPFNLGNAVKYLVRAGKKEISSELKDLKKARVYIDDYLAHFDRDAELYYSPIPTNYSLMAKGLKYEEILLLICLGGRTNYTNTTDKVCIKKALVTLESNIYILTRQEEERLRQEKEQKERDAAEYLNTQRKKDRVKELISKPLNSEDIQLTEEIIESITNLFGISIERIKGNQRTHTIILARQFIAFLLRKNGLKLKNIGEIMNRGHSTIILYLRHFKNNYETDPHYKNLVDTYLLKNMK